jgi:NADPH:quinone reductase-like Zn-dependent oxidoreductase
MKAIVLTGYGDIEKLEHRDVETPAPGPRQLKVKVAGASVNPVDWKIRRGDMRGMLPLHLPGPARLARLGEAVVKGELVLPIARRFPLRDAATAQELAEAGGIGKLLLVPTGAD